MKEIHKILHDLQHHADRTLSEFYDHLLQWEEDVHNYEACQNMDVGDRIKLIKEAYVKKILEHCKQLIPTPVQGKDFEVFVNHDPSSGEIMVRFEAYSEIGQILIEKVCTQSTVDLGIAWLEEREDPDWSQDDE